MRDTAALPRRPGRRMQSELGGTGGDAFAPSPMIVAALIASGCGFAITLLKLLIIAEDCRRACYQLTRTVPVPA